MSDIKPRSSTRRAWTSAEIADWVEVDPSIFTPIGSSDEIESLREKHAAFNRRRSAILMYSTGHSLDAVKKETGISRTNLHRLLKRCAEIHEDGRPMGFRALIKDVRIAPRNSESPHLSDLSGLLKRHSSIAEELAKYTLTGRRKGFKTSENGRPENHQVHSEFIRLCENEGIRAPNFPFKYADMGRSSIYRWRKRLLNSASKITFEAGLHNDEIYRKLKELPATEYFERMELDGHKIDLEAVVEFPDMQGGTIREKIWRIWVVFLLEFKSRCPVGYSIEFNQSNYSAQAAISAVRNGLRPWKGRDFDVRGVRYRPGEGLPSGIHPKLAFVRFSEIKLDNAKAHSSEAFRHFLDKVVGAKIILGKIKDKNDRPIVEGFNKIFEEAGIHQTIGTTGSNPNDPRKCTSDNLEYHLSVDTLLDVIDVLVARLCAAAHPNGTSPLSRLVKAVEHGTQIFRRIPIDKRDRLTNYDLHVPGHIMKIKDEAKILFKGEYYTNAYLRERLDLVGQAVISFGDSENLTSIESVIIKDGSSLGLLRPPAKWSETKHSLQTRIAIKKLLRTGKFKTDGDLPLALRRHVENEAKYSKKSRTILARLMQEQKGHMNLSTGIEPHMGKSSAKEVPKTRPEPVASQKDLEEADRILSKITTIFR